VHQAKGLEWPCVFVIGLSDGQFPAAGTAGGSEEEEEERRVFHVAVTRARDELVLVCPEWATLASGLRTRLLPSRFLNELGDAVERWQISRDP
jgi:DNA helicase-2/ATP-dependent DNA helicase PcrA